ncbi:MAG: aldehyde dehydrogenase [Christensenellales bacterium]
MGYDASMYINGERKEASNGERIVVHSPIDESVIGSVPQGTREDAVEALISAKNAQKEWARLPALDRAKYIRLLADQVIANKEELAKILSMEQGKPIKESRGEVETTALFLRFAAENASRIEGEILTSSKKDEQIWIQRVPYGVTVGLVSWNFPLAIAARKLGNALVCGNAMVLKPPSVTPLTVMKMAELVEKVGFPKGVLNIVTGRGSEMGDELAKNEITKLVSLTGGTEAGRSLLRAAAQNITVLRLELGGKAPFIIMDDVDLEKAAEAALIARFTNCGQICTCNERMYIHKNIYQDFLNIYIEKIKQLTVGNPLDEDTDIGPKVSKEELEKLQIMVDNAIMDGAKILYGGGKLEGTQFEKGYWFGPTVLEVDNNNNKIMQEEIFGPVSPVMKVNDFEEALMYANDCNYGLSAYLFTSDMYKIMQAVRELEFGEIYTNRTNGEEINAFHNGFKLSGMGGEDGKHGLEGYLQKKTVYMNYCK